MTNLKNKVALITGSARGIGKAIAERYAALGADIVVNYTSNSAAADETVARINDLGGRALAVQADVAQVADIERLFTTAQTTFGKIDIVVVNAGVELLNVPVADFAEEQYDRLFGINTKGAFFTLQQAAKHVADHGRIIYIGSSTAGCPWPGYSDGEPLGVLKSSCKRHLSGVLLITIRRKGNIPLCIEPGQPVRQRCPHLRVGIAAQNKPLGSRVALRRIQHRLHHLGGVAG